ncbi:hypothetical protein INS49_004834 [Diaporthe citri]|uniref:uncharacterized protein n=1 Tax=Diaporthe citri TaxID=83186 RepID=UPI001C82316B|nr:uncharacterized protein INS49_004834 [Diaporthe citri]KAG6354230.1 hypothetical protein INS49_004834 [Diaporthe citri]
MTDKELFNLEEMWEQAEARFNSRTGTPLHLKCATWKQFIEEIKKMRDSDTSSAPNDRLERAKESGVKRVHCLRLVGGVAARAGSLVSGPSETCFNALGVLLDIALKIRDFHKTVATMFEVLGPALSVYEIYKDKDKFDNIHPAVDRAVHDIMISFVDICGLYQKLHGNKSKAKSFWTDFKAAILNDDSGVGSEMERFKTLTQVHRDVEVTQTLNEVLETNDLAANMLLQFTGFQHDVSILRNSDEERMLQKRHQQHLTVIKDKLGWNESASKQSEATPKKKLDNIPDGTANWFRTEEQFLAWMKTKPVGETQSRPLFVLGGPEDTGKSVLMSAILRHSQTTPRTNSPLRNLVAGYFFPPSSGTKDEDRHPVRTALKCIAVQLAGQDSVFARTLRQRCDDQAVIDDVIRNGTYQQLWAFLGIGIPKDNTAHYIIIDGFASLSKEKECEEQMNQLFGILGTQLESDRRVRVAISVRSTMMSLMPDHTKRSSFVVDIVQKSAKDIQKLTYDQLKEKDLFQDEEHREIRDLVDQIAAKVQDDFSNIVTVVEQVNKLVDSCESREDIKKALKPCSTELSALSDAIRRLETELGAKEIDELQELLRWTMFGRQKYCSLDELNGALWLKFGTANTRKTQKKMAAKGRYSDIFTLDEDQDVWTKNNMRELLRRPERQLGTDETPKITASFEITKGGLQSVQTFCWSLSQQVARLSFNFDQAALAAGNVRKSFRLNEVDANISMLRSTFKILGAKPNPRTQPLGRYAMAYLPQHIERLGDVDQLERQEKIDIAMGFDDKEITTIREFIRKQPILDNLDIKDQEWLVDGVVEQDEVEVMLGELRRHPAEEAGKGRGSTITTQFRRPHTRKATQSMQQTAKPQKPQPLGDGLPHLR